VTAETVDATPTDGSENVDWSSPLRSADDVKKRVRSVIKLRQKKEPRVQPHLFVSINLRQSRFIL